MPIHVAAQWGHKDVVVWLVEHGADVNATAEVRYALAFTLLGDPSYIVTVPALPLNWFVMLHSSAAVDLFVATLVTRELTSTRDACRMAIHRSAVPP